MEPITTRSIPEQPVLAIRGVVAPALFPSFIGGAFGELYQCLETVGIDPEGPPMARYHDVGPDSIDVEICVPVPSGTIGTGRIVPGVLPAETVATVLHIGSYDGEGEAYAALEGWLQAHGYAHGGPPRERYLVGPDADVEPAEYRTQIEMPIVAA